MAEIIEMVEVKNKKQYLIVNAEKAEVRMDPHSMYDRVHVIGGKDMIVSDGYHTMDELYDHRTELLITLCRLIKRDKEKDNLKVYRSKVHADGSAYDGWFLLGILDMIARKQITYHLPMERWDDTQFAYTCETADMVPEFDGHTSADVINRLKNL